MIARKKFDMLAPANLPTFEVKNLSLGKVQASTANTVRLPYARPNPRPQFSMILK